MKLALWTYEGPPHVGAMRVATAMRGVHYVLHAPQGDTYADLLFTMIERRTERPPVTYTTFQARDLGKDTAELFKNAARDAVARYQPQALMVGASCTAELIQDDPGGLAEALGLSIPVVPLELPSYQKKENWGASETFYQLVRHLVPKATAGVTANVGDGSTPAGTNSNSSTPAGQANPRAIANILGPTALGFRHRDDLQEIETLLAAIGVQVNVIAPWQASPQDIARLPQAAFNVVLYPETAGQVASYLKRSFGQPHTTVMPIGLKATEAFVREVATLAALDPDEALVRAYQSAGSRAGWYAASVDATYLTGKRVFVFGDASHAIAAAKVATEELGFTVVGLGSYSREFARELRAAAADYGVSPLISDDYLEVEQAVEAASPDLVLGTQMERHIAKRLGVPCAVISAPVHVQDFPARYSPQMGFEGANVLFDTWVHPLMMGLEEHLLGMFKGDFEFHEGAAASHLGHGASPVTSSPVTQNTSALLQWASDAEKELGKIPFFVRGKARRNTEKFAAEKGLSLITKDTLYEAKAHYGR
ncbi:MAG: ferredoxin:protochlorophyllide reductase (ATP-dependent) subunit B [Burkholderiaceae bacterium]